jgi:hypothetical protein
MASTQRKPTVSGAASISARANRRFYVSDQPEVFLSSTQTSDAVRRAVAAGEARKIGPRLYTSNMATAPATIVRRNAWAIVAAYFPGALVADRTALEHRPAHDGSVFVVHERRRPATLEGLRIVPRPGPPPHRADRPFMGGLRLASEPRAALENMRESRSRGGVRRTLSREEMEDHLAGLADRRGERALDQLRDQARELAPALGLEAELGRLDRLIGALRGTRDQRLASARARARRAGFPYDERRAGLLDTLADHLLGLAPSYRAPPPTQDPRVFAFYEAYFSNFIEGTELALDLAEEIVFHDVIPAHQPEDAHDVKGTFELISDASERRRVPEDADELVEILRDQHAVMLAARPQAAPAEWKREPNQAGGYTFVTPELTEGTLRHGWRRYAALPEGFPRAVYAMFLVSEVHPFVDGNGRIARVLMNAELSAADQQRVLVPTIYRLNYLQALRALSRNANPDPVAKVIDFAQRYGQAVDFSSIRAGRAELEATHAFLDAHEAEEEGLRLRLPRAGFEP